MLCITFWDSAQWGEGKHWDCSTYEANSTMPNNTIQEWWSILYTYYTWSYGEAWNFPHSQCICLTRGECCHQWNIHSI